MPENRRVSTDRFYGGTTTRMANLRSLLRFVDATQPTFEDVVAWVAENTRSGSESSVERNLDFLATCAVVDRDGPRITVGRAGAAYLASRDPLDLLDGFRGGVVGFDATLKALADRPLDDDAVGAVLASAAGRDSVAEDVGRRHREWLQVFGLLSTTRRRAEVGSRPSVARRSVSREASARLRTERRIREHVFTRLDAGSTA